MKLMLQFVTIRKLEGVHQVVSQQGISEKCYTNMQESTIQMVDP